MDAQEFKRALKNINTPRKVMHAGSLHYLEKSMSQQLQKKK